MTKMTLRPTMLADLPHVVGEPLPWRIRAITALADDRVIGIGGVAFPPGGPAIAFVQFAPAPDGGSPEARRYPVTLHRAGLMAMDMIRASGIGQVIATADAGNPAAVRWLKRLGFARAERQDIEGRILFVWTQPRKREAPYVEAVKHSPTSS
jgi:RimJ/RimL family protein N-acetyltransferase